MKWKTRKQKKQMVNNKQKGGNSDVIDSYNFLLASFAHSDAKHDFKDFYNTNKTYITDSIPNLSSKEPITYD